MTDEERERLRAIAKQGAADILRNYPKDYPKEFERKKTKKKKASDENPTKNIPSDG